MELKNNESDSDTDIPTNSVKASNPFPGEYFKDQFPDKLDPRGDPNVIEFEWNPNFKELSQCDTQHMLYFLQSACEKRRIRVNERNKEFQSKSRAHRYIQHIDIPQIITNFIDWHNMDIEGNVFDGGFLERGSGVKIIGLISVLGMLFCVLLVHI